MPVRYVFAVSVGLSFVAEPCATRSAAINSLSHFTSRSLDSRPELVQLAGVAVDRAAGPRDGFAQALPAFLHLTATALQDPHPGLGRACG